MTQYLEQKQTTVTKAGNINTIKPQEVSVTLIGEDGFMVVAGAELVEWSQIQQTHGFHVFDANPFIPFQPLL
jgi:hypothetical protein